KKTDGVEEISIENAPPEAAGSNTYTAHCPSPQEILAPIRVDRELNLFRATVTPLRLIVRPAVVWVIFLYGCALSPQITLIFTMSTLLQAPPYLFSAVSIGLMQPAALVGFGLVSFGSVFTPNFALAYLTHQHQREAAQCLVLVNVVKNLVAFLFLYEAVVWVQGRGYLEVYLVMRALGVVTVAGALPLYLYE
ncbi:hypothetical protein BO82DRAFT_268924, partial [Aspergillus uvarum CBS 121591]